MSKILIFLVFFIKLNSSLRIPLKRIHLSASNGLLSLTNLTNFQYQADLSLGSPQQYANFVFDTAIGQTWINTINGHYEVSTSTTANVSQTTASIDYGMGEISGYQGTEQLNISTLTNLTMSMIFANTVTNTGVEADGVLGLSNDPTYQNPFQLAVTAGQITNGRFGFYLKDPTQNSTPQFYISSSSFPTTTLTWIPTTMTKFWAFAVVATIVGNTTYTAGTSDSQAIIDSGTAMLLIGQNSYNGLLQNQAVNQLCQLNNLFYICECPSYTTMTYPNIQFQTSNVNLTVVPNNYMLQLSGGYCVMTVSSQTQLPTMLLGDSLMNNYFVAYDKAQNRIGFSAPLSTTQSRNNAQFLSNKLKQ